MSDLEPAKPVQPVEPKPVELKQVEPKQVEPKKVEVGFFSFTEITDPGAHRAYNEWHMLDHMPEQFPLPGIALGQRWVLTPAGASRARVSGRFAGVQYVTLYLMAGPIEETLDQFAALGQHLHDIDRWFEPRRSHVSGPWSVHAMAAAPRVAIRAAAIPARPHRGVHVSVTPAPAASASAVPDSTADLARWCEHPGVAGAWSFAPDPRFDHRRRYGNGLAITVAWLDADLDAEPFAGPDDVSAALPARSDAVFAATCETITPWQWDWFEDPPPPSPY